MLLSAILLGCSHTEGIVLVRPDKKCKVTIQAHRDCRIDPARDTPSFAGREPSRRQKPNSSVYGLSRDKRATVPGRRSSGGLKSMVRSGCQLSFTSFISGYLPVAPAGLCLARVGKPNRRLLAKHRRLQHSRRLQRGGAPVPHTTSHQRETTPIPACRPMLPGRAWRKVTRSSLAPVQVFCLRAGNRSRVV